MIKSTLCRRYVELAKSTLVSIKPTPNSVKVWIRYNTHFHTFILVNMLSFTVSPLSSKGPSTGFQ